MLTTSKPSRGLRRRALAAALAALLAGCTPPGPRALLDGERLIREGRSEDAIRRLRAAVQFLPANAQAWNHLGLAYHGAKRPTEAAEAYQRALRLDRNLAVVYFNTGCLYLEYGEATLAADAMWAYVGLQPRVVEGWVKLGQAQLRTRKWDQAERSFEEALRLNPTRVDAWNGLGVALQHGRKVREAWQAFTNAVMRDPGFAPAWLNLGVIAHHNGAATKASQAYRQYARLRPQNALNLNLAAVIGSLEASVAPPAIQTPAEVPAARSEPSPARSDSPKPSPSPAAAVPRAAVDPPDPGERIPETVGVVSSQVQGVDDPALARPPPGKEAAAPTASVVTESPTAVTPPADPIQATSSLPSSADSQAAPTLVVEEPAPNPEPSEGDPPAVSVVASVPASQGSVSDAVLARALELPGPSTTPEPDPVPAPELVVPVTSATTAGSGSVSGSGSGSGSGSKAAAAVSVPAEPMDRVEIQPAENLVMGVRDENVAPAAAGSGMAEEDGLPPLIRPVAAQRSTPGTDRVEKRGFWSRANPVSWFGSDESERKPSEEVAEVAEAKSEGTGEGGSWRWANPMTWFRGTSETNLAVSAGEPSATGDSNGSLGGSTGSGAETSPGAIAMDLRMPEGKSEIGLTNREVASPRAGGTTSVRRAQAPMWASRPVASGSDPVVERAPAPEIRRYVYLRPAKPAPGDRSAAEGVLAQAQEEHRRDRTVEAVRLYEEALRLDPALSEAYLELAVAAMELGDVRRALAAGEAALTLQPQARVARLNFALALDQAGYPVDAAAEAEKVVSAKPDLVSAHLLLGNLNAQKLGRPSEARAHYLRVIELEPEHPQSVAIRRWLARNP
ncbi:MAG: tetratricopeptide repeat protein [Limisphaerales bacterium]